MKLLNREWISFSLEDSNSNINREAQKMIIHSDFLQTSDNDIGEILLTYKPQGCWINSLDTDEYSLDFPGADHIKQAGAPELVQEGLLVAIPHGAEIESVEIIDIQKMHYPNPLKIVPVPVPTKNTEEFRIAPDPYIYNADAFYPSTPVIRLGEEEFMGIYCTHLYVCPMEYQPIRQELVFFSSLTIKITYKKLSGKKYPQEIFKGNPLMRDFILGCPFEVYRNGLPRLIIITSDVLKECTSVYKEAKSNQYSVEEITVNAIHNKYSQMSKQEAIRTYLMEEHAKNPIHTVILAGNVTEVPSYGDYGCMSDSYYAQTSEDNYTPLFAISRFPASTGTELREMTEYAAKYNLQKANPRNNVILIAYNDSDFISCSDKIVAQLDSRFNPIKRYDNEWGHIDVIRSINAGSGFINYRGHGDRSGWSTSNEPLLGDIPKLSVGNNAPHIFSIACLTNSIEVDTCYGIVWMRYQKAISFLGASRESWRSQNDKLDIYLWELIDSKAFSTIGEIYQAACCKLYMNDKSQYSVENLQSYLMLGDATAEYGA